MNPFVNPAPRLQNLTWVTLVLHWLNSWHRSKQTHRSCQGRRELKFPYHGVAALIGLNRPDGIRLQICNDCRFFLLLLLAQWQARPRLHPGQIDYHRPLPVAPLPQPLQHPFTQYSILEPSEHRGGQAKRGTSSRWASGGGDRSGSAVPC